MRYRSALVTVLMALFTASAWGQTVEYVHTDTLGSPVAITNSSGTVIERTVYEPYGAVVNRALSNGPGFSGHVTDATTGLVYMQQRYYDPALGRFLSVDPVSVDGVSGDNFNRYRYASNNPYTYRDPDGQLVFLIPVVVICVEGACEAAAFWIVNAVGASAALAIIGNHYLNKADDAKASKPETKTDGNASEKKEPNNPYGSKGKPDHQAEVDKLEERAREQAGPDEKVVREKKVQGDSGSNRKPDVQIVDKDGNTRKVFEAEREPDSKYVQGKKDEYDRLGIEQEYYDLNDNLQPP
jgi:RHS repeat-associated protein